MFTKKVTDDDNFMSLSSSAQALYLHLSMSADDDGFCNQVNLSMFKAHASVQDLEALLSKRYVYQFENGVIVIKHWRMANALRKDRYTPTAFQEELAQLHIKENGAYTKGETGVVADWLPNGCQTVATDKNSIDKNSIDKSRITRARDPFTELSGNDETLTEALTAWASAVADTGKAFTTEEQKAIIEKLATIPRAEWLPNIQRSTEKRWRSVYPRKEDKKTAAQTKQRNAWNAPVPADETERLIRLTREMEEGNG